MHSVAILFTYNFVHMREHFFKARFLNSNYHDGINKKLDIYGQILIPQRLTTYLLGILNDSEYFITKIRYFQSFSFLPITQVKKNVVYINFYAYISGVYWPYL